MNNYPLPFCEIFCSIIEGFGFRVEVDSESTIYLLGSDYKIEFTLWREDTEVGFLLMKFDKEVLCYNLTNFLSSNIESDDGVITERKCEMEDTIVFKRNVKYLEYYRNIIKRMFPSIFEGSMDWLEAYEKSEWYSEPRIEKRKV